MKRRNLLMMLLIGTIFSAFALDPKPKLDTKPKLNTKLNFTLPKLPFKWEKAVTYTMQGTGAAVGAITGVGLAGSAALGFSHFILTEDNVNGFQEITADLAASFKEKIKSAKKLRQEEEDLKKEAEKVREQQLKIDGLLLSKQNGQRIDEDQLIRLQAKQSAAQAFDNLKKQRNQRQAERQERILLGAHRAIFGAAVTAGLFYGGRLGYRLGTKAAYKMIGAYHHLPARVQEISLFYDLDLGIYRDLLIAADKKVNGTYLKQYIDELYTKQYGADWQKRFSTLFEMYKNSDTIIGNRFLTDDEKFFVQAMRVGAALHNLAVAKSNVAYADIMKNATALYRRVGLV